LDQDELIDRWTFVGDELNLVAGKRGATKLGFALLLRFYTERGRFPRGRGEIPYAAVDYVARQVAVGATEIAFYEWSGRTIEFHRAQIRTALGFREGSVADAEALAEWLATNVTQSERSGASLCQVAAVFRLVGCGVQAREVTLSEVPVYGVLAGHARR
jgi:Domain of unknown function (DUF4158)